MVETSWATVGQPAEPPPRAARLAAAVFLLAILAATSYGSDWEHGWAVALTSTLAFPGVCIAVKELARPTARLLQAALTLLALAAFLPLWLWSLIAFFVTFPGLNSPGTAVSEDPWFGLLLAGLVVPSLLYFVLRRTWRSAGPRLLAGGLYCVVLIGYLLDRPF